MIILFHYLVKFSRLTILISPLENEIMVKMERNLNPKNGSPILTISVVVNAPHTGRHLPPVVPIYTHNY